MSIIYLDHAATTPIDPEVLAGLAERERTLFANPASTHPPGRAAGRALGEARARLAGLLGGEPGELVFTSGGTEALGLALMGSAGERPGHLAYSAVEHPAVVETAAWLEAQRGWRTTCVPVDGEGRVRPAAVELALTEDTRIVAVMLANNEVGTVNDVAAIARVVRARAPRARLVVDAVQAFGKVPVDVRRLDADAVAVTAHKLHGPKGIGALWHRIPLQPVMRGGGQEGGLRGGTQSAPLAWAFAEAAARHLPDMPRVTALRDRLLAGLRAAVPGVTLTGAPPGPERLGNSLHVCVPGVPGEPLLNALSAAGVCASAGSACSGGKFSRVLAAMGRKGGDGAYLRLTPGRFTTEDEVDAAVRILAEAHRDLRAMYG